MTLKELLFGHEKGPLDSVIVQLEKAESCLVNANLQNCYSVTDRNNKGELYSLRSENRYAAAKRYANKAKELYKRINIKDVAIEKRIDAILAKV